LGDTYKSASADRCRLRTTHATPTMAAMHNTAAATAMPIMAPTVYARQHRNHDTHSTHVAACDRQPTHCSRRATRRTATTRPCTSQRTSTTRERRDHTQHTHTPRTYNLFWRKRVVVGARHLRRVERACHRRVAHVHRLRAGVSTSHMRAHTLYVR
jgi:hypothetical protein